MINLRVMTNANSEVASELRRRKFGNKFEEKFGFVMQCDTSS